ncbi:MAG: protein kinase domain-containing protein [bacterium]
MTHDADGDERGASGAPAPAHSRQRFQPEERVGPGGRFRIHAWIGGGGNGEVYKAWDLQLRDWVALKRLTREAVSGEERRRRIVTEARRARSLKDPAIVTIYDVVEHDGEAIIVQEFATGAPLSDRIGVIFALPEFFRFAEACAAALVHAADKGIVHCDLKPENIIVDENGQPRILDFGTARRVFDTPRETRVLGESVTADEIVPRGGTPGYVAPEIALGQTPDPRADMYSLGVVFYEMLTGANPFLRATSAATLLAQVHEDPRPLAEANPSVPRDVGAIVMRMIARRAAERYASPEALVEALRAARRQSTASGAAAAHEARAAHSTPSAATLPDLNGVSIEIVRRVTRRRVVGLSIAGVLVLILIVFGERLAAPFLRAPASRGDSGAVRGARDANVAGAGNASAVPYLAIAPFEVLSADTTLDLFARGMTEALKARLAAIGGLYVVDAESELGVAYALTGTLQRADERLRISYLIDDRRRGHNVDGGVVEDGVANLFALQDSVAARVAGALAAELRLALRTTPARRPTADAKAYEIYLEARGGLHNYRDRRSLERAIASFEHALARDPGFALALAGLGEAYWRLYDLTKTQEWAAKAEEIALAALAMGPDFPEVHITIGTIYVGRGKPELAERAFRRALEIEPGNDAAYRGLGEAQESMGAIAAAESTFLRAIAARPDDWAGHHELGLFYYRNGRFEEALAQFRRVVGIMPENALEYSNIGGIYAYLGRPDSAIAAYETSIRLRGTAEAYSNLATLLRAAGKYETAVEHYRRAIELSPGDYVIEGNLAATLFLIPEREDDARAAVRRTIALAEPLLEVNPADGLLLADLAQFYASLAETLAARRYAERALGIEPAQGEALCGVSLALEGVGDRDGAVGAAVRALRAGYPREAWLAEPGARALTDDPRFDAAARAAQEGAPH